MYWEEQNQIRKIEMMIKIQKRLQRQEKYRIEEEEEKVRKAEEDKERKKDPYKSEISKV